MSFFLGVLIVLGALSSFASKSDSNEYYKIVETSNGLIRGILKSTLLNGTEYYSFKGIPYAKSPIGDLRFKVSFDWDIDIEFSLYYGNLEIYTN